MRNIAIGCDHGGYELKEFLSQRLREEYNIDDYGCHDTESVDYPDIAHNLCRSVEEEKNELGILICGSGNGINMSANAHEGIRSALCWEPQIASLARQHNDANIMALPGRFIDKEVAWECVQNFLNEEFEGGRHERRISKIKVWN